MPTTKLFIVSIFSVLLITASVFSQVIVSPGDPAASLQANDCAYLSDGLIGECFDCRHECVIAENKTKAAVAVEALDVGRRRIVSTVMTEFTVSSTDLNIGNYVTGELLFDIEWLGYFEYAKTIFDYDPNVKISLWVKDLTRDQILESVMINEIDNSTIGVAIDIVEIGLGRDLGTKSGALNMNLIRGNNYRVHLTIDISLTAFSTGNMKIEYFRFDRGAWWNDLSIQVFPDLEERVSSLEARVDSLEDDNEKLWNALETHTHTYYTGKGNGHNNVMAETSPAILLEEELVDESQLEWLTDSDQAVSEIPTKSVVLSNYPNPFNPSTTIQYSLPEDGHTSIEIYNVLGQKVKNIIDEFKSAGEHYAEFDASEFSSGVYYYRLVVGNYSETRKMSIIK